MSEQTQTQPANAEATEAVAKPVPIILSREWLLVNPLPSDAEWKRPDNHEGAWAPSIYRGQMVPRVELNATYPLIYRSAQPTPAGPTAGDSMDVHLKAARERIAELEKEQAQKTKCGKCGEVKHTPWRDNTFGYVCLKCLGEGFAEAVKQRDLKEKYFWELGQIECTIDGEGNIQGTGWSCPHKKVLKLLARLTVAETKAGAMEEALQVADAALQKLSVVLANQPRRDDPEARRDACREACLASDRIAALALPPAPSVASEKEGK